MRPPSDGFHCDDGVALRQLEQLNDGYRGRGAMTRRQREAMLAYVRLWRTRPETRSGCRLWLSIVVPESRRFLAAGWHTLPLHVARRITQACRAAEAAASARRFAQQ